MYVMGIVIFVYMLCFVFLMFRCLKHEMYKEIRVRLSTLYFLLYAIGGVGLFTDNLPVLCVFGGLGMLLDYCCEIHYMIVIQKQEEMKHRQSEWRSICAGGKMNKQYDWLK